MFIEERLLDKVAYGSEFGQEFNTRITEIANGYTRRNIEWSMPLGMYSVSFQALDPRDHDLVRGAHMACHGAAIAFRFKDWVDFRAELEIIGVGTGGEQVLQLTKLYQFGTGYLDKIIKKPVSGTITIYEWDGDPDSDPEPIAATIDYTKGLVTVTATEDYSVLWSGEFDIPVRFSDDRLDFDPVALTCDGQYRLSANVDLQEVRG